MESPEREWWLNDRLKKLDHVAHADVTHTLPFRRRDGRIDAIFPDELQELQVKIGGALFQEIDEQGEGAFAGEVLVGAKRYGGEL